MLYEQKYSIIVDDCSNDTFIKSATNRILKYAKSIPPKSDILEIGCNKGNLMFHLHGLLPKASIAGIDINTDAISICKKRGLNCQVSSAERLPFKNNFFDFVFSSHTFEHVPNLPQALKELSRVLRPNGKAIIIVPPNWLGLETVRVALKMKSDLPWSYNKIVSVLQLCKKLHPNTFGYPWGRAVQTTQRLLNNHQIPLKVAGGMLPTLIFSNELLFSKLP